MTLDTITPKQTKDGRRYYSFGVTWRVVASEPVEPEFVTTYGWRYFPDKDALSTPSINVGKKFINTHRISADMYNEIKEKIQELTK